jgi:hypothetical protein
MKHAAGAWRWAWQKGWWSMTMKVRWPLAFRLALLMALFGAILVSSVAVLAYAQSYAALQKAIVTGLASARMEKIAALNGWVEEGRRHIGTLALSPRTREQVAALGVARRTCWPS